MNNFNTHTMKKIFKNSWKSMMSLQACKLHRKFFLSFIFFLKEKELVISGDLGLLWEPSASEGFLVGFEQLFEIKFMTTCFWVKAYDVPVF